MKVPISSKLLIILLVTSLIPLIITGFVGYASSHNITDVAAAANQDIATLAMSDSMAALAGEKETDLRARTESLAQNINAILMRVQADTAELAAYGTFLYNNPDSFGRYPSPSVYSFSPDGVFGSLEENDNSWLMVSVRSTGDNQVSPELMEEIYLTEFMDVKFRSIAANNPYAVQLYWNTRNHITRGMPFVDGEYVWVNGPANFQRDLSMPDYDFYFLADEAHNPEKQPVWTELYWDPAGLGWLVSSIAPVYVGDELQGVAGIDITLGKMVEDIINVQIEESGFAFLMSDQGQAIAFPERGADFLGFTASLEGDFGDDQEFSFFLTDNADPPFQAIVADMLAGKSGLVNYMPAGGDDAEYLFAYHPVALTDWSVGIVVPYEEVIAPALRTNTQIQANMQATSQNIDERSQAFITTFLLIIGGIIVCIVPLSLAFSRSISTPIHKLEEGSRKIGSGDLTHRIDVRSGDEIEELARTFNEMADELQGKITEIEAANAELMKLDEMKSQFISMASHELRTPLIAIQGYVDLLRDGDAGSVSAEQMTMLNTVSRNTVRLARIVAELLDLSRIEENKLALNLEPFVVADLLRETVEEQRPSLARRQHHLTLDVAPDLPLLVADRDRIVQVVVNLLGNAIKYTPNEGQIRIQAQAEGENLHLMVADNGVGIHNEHLEKIFSRFYTANDVTKHQSGKEAFLAGGTGLGLPIVKGIVEAHEGQVWVESEFGVGTTFHVTLPFLRVTDGDTAVPPLSTAQIFRTTEFAQLEDKAVMRTNGAAKVLIIDDEMDAIEVTKRILSGKYEVLSAATSAAGLKAALTEHPGLILLDAWMPGISGYDVCKTLKNNATTRHIPVIMFTAATQQADEERARAVGADAFITKPFQKVDLLRLIEGFKHA